MAWEKGCTSYFPLRMLGLSIVFYICFQIQIFYSPEFKFSLWFWITIIQPESLVAEMFIWFLQGDDCVILIIYIGWSFAAIGDIVALRFAAVFNQSSLEFTLVPLIYDFDLISVSSDFWGKSIVFAIKWLSIYYLWMLCFSRN